MKVKQFALQRHKVKVSTYPISFVLAIAASCGSSDLFEALYGNDFHKTVGQQSCSSKGGTWDITLELAYCLRCHNLVSKQKLASKGKNRKSRLCKDCDNKRRRTNYQSQTKKVRSSEFTVRSEPSICFDQHDFTELIFGLLQDHQLIKILKKEEDVSALVRRQNIIDLI